MALVTTTPVPHGSGIGGTKIIEGRRLWTSCERPPKEAGSVSVRRHNAKLSTKWPLRLELSWTTERNTTSFFPVVPRSLSKGVDFDEFPCHHAATVARHPGA